MSASTTPPALESPSTDGGSAGPNRNGLGRRIWRRRPSPTMGFAIFLVINLILVSAYLWSRGGQTVHIRVEAQGNQFTAYVDGKLNAEGEFNAPSSGGIALIQERTYRVPSLPRPRGIDSVRVTDLASGDLLFEDDFSSGYGEEWEPNVVGAFSTEGGALGARGRGVLTLSALPARDYAVDVEYKNIEGGAIMLRSDGTSTGVVFNFRAFRRFTSSLAFVSDGQTAASVPGAPVELSGSESIKSLLAMTLNPYPLALLLLALGLVAVAGLHFARIRPPLSLSDVPSDLPWLAAGVVAGSAFAVTLVLIYSFGSHLPHVPDSIAYIFQAKVFASGHLSAPTPPVQDTFDFFFPPFIIPSEGKWAAIYPFGHPLMLAVGERLGAIWLIPPLVGAASVALVFAIGRKIYHARVGLLAALLLATSPFFLMTASNFMAHNTAAFYLLGSLLFLAFIDRRPLLYGVLAGLLFGLAFNTRALTTTALILPFGLYLVALAIPRGRRLLGLQQIGAFAFGGLVMLGAYWLYNFGTTGDAFTSGYQAASDARLGASTLGERVGFGGRHSLAVGLQNEQTQMSFLLLVLNGWPRYVGLMFVLLPFILATRHRWDWFLLLCAASIMGAWTFFEGDGVMHGPRYWYEATPFLMLLAARGAERAAELLADGAAWLGRALGGAEGRPLWAGLLIVYGLVGVLIALSVNGWLLGNQDGWNEIHVPDRAAALRGFNFADDRLVRLVEEADLDNALVLVERCPNWWCYGTVFWMNSPTLDGDVVFARDLAERREELFRAYPERAVYQGTYTDPSLTPFGATTLVGEGEEASAPLAKELLPMATPTPTPPFASLPTPTSTRTAPRPPGTP